jgi:hypothetical protein
MSGNQDNGAGPGERPANARAWVEDIHERLKAQVVRAVEAIEAHDLNPQAPLNTQRFSRAIEFTGKAAMTLEKMATGPAPARRTNNDVEQDVSKADRDDSPENLQRIRDELMDGFDRMHAQLEQKTVVRDPDTGRFARAAEPASLAA